MHFYWLRAVPSPPRLASVIGSGLEEDDDQPVSSTETHPNGPI